MNEIIQQMENLTLFNKIQPRYIEIVRKIEMTLFIPRGELISHSSRMFRYRTSGDITL